MNTELIVQSLKLGKYDSVKEIIARSGVNCLDKHGRSILMYACQYPAVEIAYWAIQSGAKVNHQDTKGNSALHYAVSSQRLDIINLLLLSGVKVDLLDAHGNSALWRGMMDHVDSRIIKLLLDHDADPDLKNHYGISSRDLLSEENKNWPILMPLFEDALAKTEH
ncbi:ankyrin repeat domain-containing protein [Sphingobacterium lactis]|uniref:ankyrin repeat domain-containing protein n=1 Tax=Sphingobacterium lactis TaxID=797291 RepID=UPI003DA3C1EE